MAAPNPFDQNDDPPVAAQSAAPPANAPPANPFDQYDDPAQQALVNTGNIASQVGEWARPKEDVSSLQGAKTTAGDLLYTAANTFGAADQASAINAPLARSDLPTGVKGAAQSLLPLLYASGAIPASSPDLKAAQADSAAARARLGGGLSAAADTAGYYPFTMAGIGPGITKSMGYAAPVFRRIVGQTVEGGVGGGIAAEGHDTNVPLGVAVGAGTSFGASPLTGFANWASQKLATAGGRLTGTLSTPDAVVAQTAKDTTAAYHGPGGTDDYRFNSSDPVAAYNAGMNSLTGPQKQGLSGPIKNTFAGHIQAMNDNPTASATDIDGYARRLRDQAYASGTYDDQTLAQKVRANTDNMMGIGAPTTGQPVGSALDQVEAARQAAQQSMMAQGLQKATTNLTENFDSPNAWARREQQNYASGSPTYNQLGNVIRATGTEAINPHTTGTLSGMAAEGVGGAVGGPTGALLAEAAAKGMYGPLKGWTQMLKRGGIANELGRTWGPATGTPTTWDPGAGELIRQAALGSEASRGY